MAKRMSEYQLLRWVIIVALILYIVGVVPNYNKGVVALFTHPFVRLLLLVLIVGVSWVDHTIGILVAVAYLSSIMMSRHPTPNQTPLGAMEAEMRELPLPGLQAQAPVNAENMANPMNQTLSVPEAYAQQEAMDQRAVDGGGGQDCWSIPPPTTGCDPIVGYNASYDCVCAEDCVENCDQKGRGCLCTGVATWSDELNAQGMNYPMGAPGSQVGATF